MHTLTDEEFELFKKLLEKEEKKKNNQHKSYKKFYMLNKNEDDLTEEQLKIKNEKIQRRKKYQLDRYYRIKEKKKLEEQQKN